MRTFCEVRTCQNKMANMRSDNTNSDEIVFNYSAGVDDKDNIVH